MKKIIICLVVFLTFIFNVNAEEIKSFDSKIIINKDALINVKETIVYDFGNLSRHGIYRNIPYIKINQDGKKYQLDFNSFSVTDENGSVYNYSKSTLGDNVQLKIGDPDITITGIHTYIIDYKVGGAISYFSDHDELYWNVTGNEWEVPILTASAEINLPKEIKPEEIIVGCFTGLFSSTESECEINKDNNSVKFSSNNSLGISEGLTVVVGLPIDVIAHLEPKEIVNFWDTFVGKLIGFLLGLAVLIWYLLLPLYIIYRWIKYGRDPKATTGVTTAWYDPPKTNDNKRFLTPGEVGALGDETVDLKDISATIIDLARKGYLRIEERKKGDFYLIKLDNNKPLLEFEKLLINEFFKSEKEIRLKDKHLYEEVEKIKSSLYDLTVKDGLFPKNPQSVRTGYYILAGIAMFTGNIFLALTAFIFGRVMPRKTVEGVNAFNVSKSLKNFLTSQERQLTFQADKQMMFEKLLPFAVAFGVEKIWAKRFKDLDLKQPDWYSGYTPIAHFNSTNFVNNINSSMSSFRSAATPTRSSSGFSSGFSSGGGFSGGGGGGGGGGSW